MFRVVATINIFVLALTTYGALGFAGIPMKQDKPIKVSFEVDGKELKQPMKILLSVEGSIEFEPAISDGGFIFPPELKNYERVRLRFISGEYDLNFGDVYISKFSGKIIFGVDKEPFDEENVAGQRPPDGKELVGIYYIIFRPEQGLATREDIYVYR